MNNKKLKIDLGCGQNCNVENITLSKENLVCDHRWIFSGYSAKCRICESTGVKFTGVDFKKCDGVDIEHDLTSFPYPFEDESVDEVFSSHFIEHLDGFQRIKFMEEIYRILTPYGKVKFIHPYYKSVRAIQDPTHAFPPLAESSYLYWNKKWMDDNKLDHYGIKCNFEIKNIFYTFQDGAWSNKSEDARTFAIDKYWNIVADMVVELEKIPSDKKTQALNPENKVKHSIIIPTYNKCTQLLKPCVESIIQFTNLEETEVIVSANGCTDETREYINNLSLIYPNIKLVWSDERLGYPKAVNAGIREAKGKYIIPLNNDTVLLSQQKNDWINIMKKPFLEDETVGLTAPMKTFSPSANRTFLIFFCVMIDRKVIDKIGLLDESFGDGYGEDTAFCCEAEDAGFKVVQVPEDSQIYYAEKRMTGNFPIWHEGNVTFKDWKDGDKLLANNNAILSRYNPDNKKKSDKETEIMKYSLLGNLSTLGNMKFANKTLSEAEEDAIMRVNSSLPHEQVSGSKRAETISNSGLTMMGLTRLNSLEKCVDEVIKNNIQGDFVETGVWRGGACIFMAYLLKKHKKEKNIYVCDSFKGLPEPDEKYPLDSSSSFHDSEILKVSLEAVKSSFEKYKLLDENIKFIEGYFSETMINFPSQRISLLRLDGDMYSSTWDVLINLYKKVSIGGIIIVDDYALVPCRKAVDDFRAANNITDEIINIDDTGVYWVKTDNSNMKKKFEEVDISKAVHCDGYMSEIELRWLARAAKKSKVCVEIGSWHGRSSRAIGDNLPEGGVLYCIDTFNGSIAEQDTHHSSAKLKGGDHAFYEFLQNNYDLIAAGKIIPLRMTGDNAADLFTEKGIKFDFCFIDAGHTYNEVFSDIIKWSPLVKEGAILSGHDYYTNGIWEGVKDAVNQLVPNVSVAQEASIWYTKVNSFLYEKINNVNKPKVYDCFLLNDELDILEIRLNEHYDFVDRFVISEAILSHGGKQKPLYFNENIKRFEKFLHKITYIVVDQFPALDSWSIERHQRDSLMRGLTGCKDSDIIIMGDLDEITKKEVVQNYNPENGLCCISQKLFYYYLNCQAETEWNWLRILPYSIMKKMTPCEVRYTVNYDLQTQIIKDGGWHFSWIGDVDKIIKKLEDTAHQDLNRDEFKDREKILKLVEQGKDLFGREELKYKYVDIDSSYPKFILDNLDLFYGKKMIK